MSHAAIVCREYGLPAVVGTGRATSQIRTGQTIRVDGSDGVVTLLDGPDRDWRYGRPLAELRRDRRAELRRQERQPRRAAGGGHPGAARIRALDAPLTSAFLGTRVCRWTSTAGARRADGRAGRPLRVRLRRDRRGDAARRRCRRRCAARSRAATPSWPRRPATPRRPSRCARARSARTARRRRSPASRRPSCGCAAPSACCDAVRDCWVSLYSPTAVSYRARLGGPAAGYAGDGRRPCRLMVDAAVSGVMFTCNPVSGDPSMVAINASWGLGQAVVGGEVTPDDYLRQQGHRRGVREHVGPKDDRVRARTAGGGTVRATCRRAPRRPCLDADDLDALVDVARRVERHFGSHQDIEWAIARDGRRPTASSSAVAPGHRAARARAPKRRRLGDRAGDEARSAPTATDGPDDGPQRRRRPRDPADHRRVRRSTSSGSRPRGSRSTSARARGAPRGSPPRRPTARPPTPARQPPATAARRATGAARRRRHDVADARHLLPRRGARRSRRLSRSAAGSSPTRPCASSR